MRLSLLCIVVIAVIAQEEEFVAAEIAPMQPEQIAQQRHWSEVCATDIEVLCQDELGSEECVDGRGSGPCKSKMFNCVDAPDQVVTAPCQEAIDSRNAKAAAAAKQVVQAAPAQAASCPPQEQPTCPLPAMHIRSARLALKCATFTKQGQFATLAICKDQNAKQNFALAPVVDGVKILFSSSPQELSCLDKNAKLGDCGPDSAQSFRLVRTDIQSVQLQMVGTNKCLAAPKNHLVLLNCINLKQGKKLRRQLKTQSFYVEPTLAVV